MDPTLTDAVTFDNISGYAINFLAAVIMAFAAWGIAELRAYAKRKFNIQIDDAMADRIDSVILKGIDYVKGLGGKYVQGKAVVISNDTIRAIATYVEKAVPDALRHHGITEERLAQIVTARLGNQYVETVPADSKLTPPQP